MDNAFGWGDTSDNSYYSDIGAHYGWCHAYVVPKLIWGHTFIDSNIKYRNLHMCFT
jgi:hypothetical protein